MTLPQGWVEATIEDVAYVRNAKALPGTLGEAPFIGLEHIAPHTSQLLDVGRASDVRSAVVTFEAGDILYGRLRPYLNKVIEADFDGCASAEIIPFVPADGVNPRYLRHLMMSADFLAFSASLDRGDRPRVAASEVVEYRMCLPPTAEQRRIVAKLDALTARLTRARAELDRVPVLAEKLRTAALRSAFTLSEADVSSRSWPMTTLRVAGQFQLGKMLDKAKNKGTPNRYLRNINVRWLTFDLSDLATMPYTLPELQTFDLRRGDVLVCEGGEPGRCAVWGDDASDIKFQKALHRIRPSADHDGQFIAFYLMHLARNGDLAAHFTGSTIKHLSQVRLMELPYPQVAIENQQGQVARIKAAFTHADRMEAEARRARALLDRLEAAILARAFRGELVPQDPADEPASSLLARIRATRAATPQARRGRKPAS